MTVESGINPIPASMTAGNFESAGNDKSAFADEFEFGSSTLPLWWPEPDAEQNSDTELLFSR